MSKRKVLSDVNLSRIIAYDQSSSASIKLAIFDHQSLVSNLNSLGKPKHSKGKITLPISGHKSKKFC